MSAMIEVENLTKYYHGQRVMDDLTLSVNEGEQLGVLGPGGAGKTLLIKMICGLVAPDSGQVRINGRNVVGASAKELQEIREDIGLLFQNYALFDFLTVEDNIAFPLRREGKLSEPEILEKVNELLEAVNLPGINQNFANELSGGMKKRVTFARAVIHQPPVLFYDDPTMGLDPVTSSKIFIMLDRMKRERNVTSLCTTHDIDGIKDTCDNFVLLNKGKLVLHGTPKEFENSSNRLVRQFWDSTIDE